MLPPLAAAAAAATVAAAAATFAELNALVSLMFRRWW